MVKLFMVLVGAVLALLILGMPYVITDIMTTVK